MTDFLAIQVRFGKITLEQVPEKYRTEVEEILSAHSETSAYKEKR